MNDPRLYAVFLLFTLAASFAPAAHAQTGNWYVAPAVVYNDDDPDRKTDDGVSGAHLSIGRNVGDNLALEGVVSYSDIDGFYTVAPNVVVRDNEFQTHVSARALAFYDRDASFTLYGLIGLGYLNRNINVADIENNPTASVGGGFKWRLGQSRFALRAEGNLRYVHDGGGRTFNDYVADIGLQYNFGARSERRVYDAKELKQDADGDGVVDLWDDCPDTPSGVRVNSRGCEIVDTVRDMDSDRDGVPTGDDRCPNSRPGAVVDAYGCEPRDDDNDNVPNSADRCPNTRTGANVDEKGCEIREVISLPGVNFESGSDRLVSGANQLVRQAAETLKANQGWLIEVAGHTDSVGNEVDNQGLSDRRAKTVYDFLIRFGVSQERLSFRGYGERQPIASNDSAAGRAMNRRVELRVAKP